MSKGAPRLAITHGLVDLLRITPSRLDGNKLDLFIDPLGNDWSAFCYRPMQVNPTLLYESGAETNVVTYHHGVGGKDVVIHMKRRHHEEGEQRYFDLPLGNVQAPSVDLLVPLPVMKIEVPDNVSGREFRKKRNGERFDIEGGYNVVEVFMTGAEHGIQDITKEFPEILDTLFSMPFECWSSCNTSVNRSRQTLLMDGGPVPRYRSFALVRSAFYLLPTTKPSRI